MDPVSLIASAVLTGAATAVTDTAAQVIRDAYASLKSLLKRKLGDNPTAEMVLDDKERQPDEWRQLLERHLAETGADEDEEVIRAAQRVLALTDPQGARRGKYDVTVSGGKGVVVGDYAQVTMNFDERD